ncbi:MAG: nucleotide exchange factor GrpE [Nitrospinae bacterium]|nr:nucleotide exchange factor GrpE [Nitrospinota bacterium]
MSKKDSPPIEEEKIEEPDEDNDALVDDPLSTLQEALQKSEEGLAAQKDQFARLQAETDNFRKRMVREKEEFAQFANERLLKGLIPIFDNLERALEAPSSDAAQLKEGVEMILKQFESFLEKEKVVPIKAVGEKFDPSIHDVVSQEESDEHEENTVIRQFAKGYQLNNRVLRPAQVVITRKPAKSTKKSGNKKEKKAKEKRKKT